MLCTPLTPTTEMKVVVLGGGRCTPLTPTAADSRGGRRRQPTHAVGGDDTRSPPPPSIHRPSDGSAASMKIQICADSKRDWICFGGVIFFEDLYRFVFLIHRSVIFVY